MANVTRRIGLSLGADICWPIAYEEIMRRLDLTIPVDGDNVRFDVERVMIEPNSLGLIPRITVNPFWHQKKPYQLWRPIMLQDELYGIGTIEMIARNSMELDTKKNTFMAATQLEANPMWMISDDD